MIDLDLSVELLLVSPQSVQSFLDHLDESDYGEFNRFLMKKGSQFQFVESPKRGRAVQFNLGVQKARNEKVFLMHIDSYLDKKAAMALKEGVAKLGLSHSRAYYFSLEFFEGPRLLKWNSAWGNYRADKWGMIYGDQGFLLKRSDFLGLGAFREELPYGEDHDFVWRSKLAGLRWESLGTSLKTSGRAYQGRWLSLSLKRIFLGFKQSLPFQIKHFTSRKRSQVNELKKMDGGCPKLFAEDAAIVVFVKTPGLSPLKTRLAAGIGKLRAENFHLIACKKIESSLRELQLETGIHPFWAVAEKDALDAGLWERFPVFEQAQGGLGERLHHAYDLLKKKYNKVLFIGADCPQLSKQTILECIEGLNTESDFFVGPAKDGGYYLFGGKKPLSSDLWTSVPYSAENTAKVFIEELKRQGSVYVSNTELEDADTKHEYENILPLMY